MALSPQELPDALPKPSVKSSNLLSAFHLYDNAACGHDALVGIIALWCSGHPGTDVTWRMEMTWTFSTT